ncbi:MAG: LON peptidase substrate-binding domain-containing protein [Nitriliruptoraceae bacterium]
MRPWYHGALPEVNVPVLPMFPLATVLLPHMALPLHVFEPRYRALMDDVHGATDEFGITLITRGAEVGGGDDRARVGTVARIMQAEQLDDGRWLMITLGTRRFRVDRWLDDAPYPRAEITHLDEPEVADDHLTRLQDLRPRLRDVLQLHALVSGASDADLEDLPDDPDLACWMPAVVAPLGDLDAQRILEADDWTRRLDVLETSLDDLHDALTFQLDA